MDKTHGNDSMSSLRSLLGGDGKCGEMASHHSASTSESWTIGAFGSEFLVFIQLAIMSNMFARLATRSLLRPASKNSVCGIIHPLLLLP